MPRITHIALKVENLDEATRFYEEVFGFKTVMTGAGAAHGHISRHMTDGYMDLSLMLYDSEDAPEAQLAGKGPCIHHIGIDVEDRAAYEQKIRQFGGEILSDPKTKGALKFRAPDGTVAEIVEAGRYEDMRRKQAG